MDWYETSAFNMVSLQICLLLLLSMLPVGLIRAIRNRAASRPARAADSILFGISLLNALFLVGIAIWFRPMRPSELHGISLIVEIVMGLGVLSALLTLAALVYTVLAWKNKFWGVAYRVYYTLVMVAAVGFVWFLHYWNWLGWRY